MRLFEKSGEITEGIWREIEVIKMRLKELEEKTNE